MKRHVRHELKEEGPTIWVGKEGLTSAVAAQVEAQLERTKMVKIRILKSALATDKANVIANRTAEQVNAALVEVRGHVFILYRRRKKTPTDQERPPNNQGSSKR
jgi:putative YhbY family RNA-binding protein